MYHEARHRNTIVDRADSIPISAESVAPDQNRFAASRREN